MCIIRELPVPYSIIVMSLMSCLYRGSPLEEDPQRRLLPSQRYGTGIAIFLTPYSVLVSIMTSYFVEILDPFLLAPFDEWFESDLFRRKILRGIAPIESM